MLQPIELLEKELIRLRDIVEIKELNSIVAEENIMIPAYENSIKFLEAVNDADASQHRALHKHIVMQGEAEPLPDDDHVKLKDNGFDVFKAAINQLKGNGA